jgi:hypothetical protein
LGPQCTKEELDQEVNWIENTLTGIFNQFARPIRITPLFKRWWTPEVQEARTEYARVKRRLKESQQSRDRERVKRSRNTLYTIIRKIKRECWELFL